MSMITFWHFDKNGRKIQDSVHKRDWPSVKIFLLESSFIDNLGEVYYNDGTGEDKVLDYYNDGS